MRTSGLYTIFNPNPGPVFIPELNVEIGQNRTVDLEEFISRKKLRASETLRRLIREKKLRLVVDQKPKTVVGRKVTHQHNHSAEIDLDKLATIIDKRAEEKANAQVAELKDLLLGIKNQIGQSTTTVTSGSVEGALESGTSVDPHLLAEITQKSIDQSGLKGQGKKKKKKTKKKSRAADLADEL